MALVIGTLVAVSWAADGPSGAIGALKVGPHPRLLLGADFAQRIARQAAGDRRCAALRDRVMRAADLILTLPPLERKLQGKRLLFVSRAARERVGTLALAYRMSGDRKYLDAAAGTLRTVCAFADFNPSHFLDVAEMSAALGIGYDWLAADLSDADKALIRAAIVDKCLKPSFPKKPHWWVKGMNNWNQVCHGGLVLGALAIADEEPELARRVVDRAVDGLPVAMKLYAPNGAYPEGVGYWGYGTTYNALALGAMETALGQDFGLAQTPGFLKTADYHLHLIGPSGRAFSYCDGSETYNTPSPAMFYLARRLGRPELLHHEWPLLDGRTRTPVTAKNFDEDWLMLAWYPGPQKESTDLPTHYDGSGGITPVATHRSGWDAGATFVGIKGGSAGSSHGHMDVGSFCLDADGVRWASDLGMQDYNSLETRKIDLWNMKQTSQRWQVYRLGPGPHNILTLDAQPQRVDGHAPITKTTANETIVDLSAVYAGQFMSARRGVQLRPDRSVRLQDELRTPPADKIRRPTTAPATATQAGEQRVRWAMLTTADVTPDGNHAVLRQGGKTLQLRVISPAGAVVRVESTQPPHDYDAPNPGTRLVTFEVTLPPNQSATLAVDFVPGEAADASKALPLVPLEKW